MAHVDQKKRERLTIGLIKRTLSGDIPWKSDQKHNRFAVDFDRSSITLHRGNFAKSLYNVVNTPFVSVVDSKGEIVDQFSVNSVLSESADCRERLIPLTPGPHHVVTGDPKWRRTYSEQTLFPEPDHERVSPIPARIPTPVP